MEDIGIRGPGSVQTTHFVDCPDYQQFGVNPNCYAKPVMMEMLAAAPEKDKEQFRGKI